MSFIDLVPEKSEPIEIKSKIQEELDKQKEAFFKRGGKLEEVPPCMCTEKIIETALYNYRQNKDKKAIERASRNAGIQSSLTNKKYKDAK